MAPKKQDPIIQDSEEAVVITKEGLKALEQELEQLKTVRRKQVAERLKEAISYGDLSENSEYEEAKNEQAFVEGRILELEEKVKNVKIISDKRKAKTIQLGTTVHLRNLTKNREELEVYAIVGSTEADPFEGRISNESPIGSSLLDKEKGDTIRVVIPAGTVEYKVMKLD